MIGPPFKREPILGFRPSVEGDRQRSVRKTAAGKRSGPKTIEWPVDPTEVKGFEDMAVRDKSFLIMVFNTLFGLSAAMSASQERVFNLQ